MNTAVPDCLPAVIYPTPAPLTLGEARSCVYREILTCRSLGV